MQLSAKSLELLSQLFSEKSNLQLPVGCANEVVEIRKAVAEELKPTDGLPDA